jgi:hypothetical protein
MWIETVVAYFKASCIFVGGGSTKQDRKPSYCYCCLHHQSRENLKSYKTLLVSLVYCFSMHV